MIFAFSAMWEVSDLNNVFPSKLTVFLYLENHPAIVEMAKLRVVIIVWMSYEVEEK